MTELARPLETGWLPDTPTGDSLLRRFVVNQADLQDHLVGAVGGRSDRTPDVALSDSGVAAAVPEPGRDAPADLGCGRHGARPRCLVLRRIGRAAALTMADTGPRRPGMAACGSSDVRGARTSG